LDLVFFHWVNRGLGYWYSCDRFSNTNLVIFKKKFRVETNDKSETETWKRLAVMIVRKPFPRCFTSVLVIIIFGNLNKR